jgi:hypothetical protein
MWRKRTTRPSQGLFKQDGKCKTDTSESLAKMSTRVEAPRVGTRDSCTMGKNTVAAAADLWQPSADTAHLPVNPVAPRMTRSYFRSLPPKIPLTGDCPPLLARFLGEIALKTLERVSIVVRRGFRMLRLREFEFKAKNPAFNVFSNFCFHQF